MRETMNKGRVHMIDSVLILIIIVSIVSSIFEYRKLIFTLHPDSSEDFVKFVSKDALTNHIKGLDNDSLREFCLRYFNKYGYPMDSPYNGILLLKGWRHDYYIKYISSCSGRKAELSDTAELLGFMQHDGIRNGIIITTSIFDDKILTFCRESNIDAIDIDTILHGIENMDEKEAANFLPGTG